MKEHQGEAGELGQEFDRALDQLVKRDDAINALMRELAHRNKNQLALLIALMTQLAINRESVAEYKEAVAERLLAQSASQDLLLKTDGVAVDLEELIHGQLKGFDVGKADRIQIGGPKQALLPDRARSLGMAIHELATNATKYGSLSNRDGFVKISWTAPSKTSDNWEFTWEEFGGPPVKEPGTSGFGSALVQKIVPVQMNGNASISYKSKGLRWVLRYPGENTSA